MARSLTIDGDQLGRLMQICRYLGAGRNATFEQLQRRVRASRRTLFRDFNDLAKMGVRIDFDGRGYRIRQNATACRGLIRSHQLKAVNKLLTQCHC